MNIDLDVVSIVAPPCGDGGITTVIEVVGPTQGDDLVHFMIQGHAVVDAS